jgi:hypothetical protein
MKGGVLCNASRLQVNNFLQEFKEIVTTGRGLDIIPRPINNATILMLGLTRNAVKNELLSLTVEDYCYGPEPDQDQPGELWIFGKEINTHDIYIKLKIAKVNNIKIAKCISFHEAQHPIDYAFK